MLLKSNDTAVQAKQKIKFRLNLLWKDNCGIWGQLSEIIIGNYFIGKHDNNVKGVYSFP